MGALLSAHYAYKAVEAGRDAVAEAHEQALQAKRQAQIAQEALLASTRARLKITAIANASVTGSGGSAAWFNFTPTYKNFGRSPAQGIFFNPHIFVVGAGPSPREVCEEDKARHQGTTEMSDEVVFPQDEGGRQRVGVLTSLADLVRGADKVHSIQASATIYLGVVGCLVYQSTDSTTAYVTGFVADLHPADTPDPANYVSVYDIIIGRYGGPLDLKMSVKTLGAWAN
ncbi:MAG: hypothetical protein P4L90_25525 [Rhodopila sp.]|nr:hypothetical protein [Rhodopila sp.]